MTQDVTIAAVRAAAGSRATLRFEGDRAGIVLDATGLSASERATLEAEVRAAAERSWAGEVRLVVTAERVARRLIAVASGKGGVGKSTLAANLAIALKQTGRRVGLVDADIYGPSQPRLMAAEGQRPTAKDKVLNPVPTPYGVPMLSMGQLVEDGRALAWRGPMVAGALTQLVEADWGATDTLVLDLPPGTGDVQLTMVQKHKPAGAVIVSTPQDLALIDATRAIDLFDKAGVPVIGLVENMAGYACPHCGKISDPFGQGGAEATAQRLGLPFLGRVPLAIDIRTASDAGKPPAADPNDTIFAPIAARVADWLATH
ncbi:Mrp/NBP35 family ATP-binding protein [Sphingomonas sp. S6]|jgi:ATP-binding protein involved in chromosome partitioning|uniref:Mrp/NBP35 family ATP-binding protein n=1 Tax=Sphingomonas sp. S6 TaxID=3368600 RepID=UPI000F9CDF84|nr:Mrp/NBP35 family ATP-binding protein [uncultured Sphingomonas sp.]RTL14397.1 MAG: ATP-binding protein [Sphingomonadaceae bacterium]